MNSVEAVLAALRDHGVVLLYFKRLAANDNSKNQIYLGSGFKALNLLPTGEVKAVKSGKNGREVFHASVRLSWLTRAGNLSPAPETKLILYPQYPEVRLSAFLLGSPEAPSDLLAGRGEGRVLLLGITADQGIVGFAAAGTSAVARELEALDLPKDKALHAIDVSTRRPSVGSRTQVIDALTRIHARGWIDSHKLTSAGKMEPCRAPHCGGLTLEAELGVVPNGRSEPDFLGWEIKQVGASASGTPARAITLMTPEPDGGFYKTSGTEAFIRRFGYKGTRGRADRLNFGGVHIVGPKNPRTSLSLALSGYDAMAGRVVDPSGAVVLIGHKGEVAASWAFTKLMSHWKRKHANVLFATSVHSKPKNQYKYGSKVWLGEGTDFLRLLASLASSGVYYDPGMKLMRASTKKPEIKRRSQFRAKFSSLRSLYEKFEQISLHR